MRVAIAATVMLVGLVGVARAERLVVTDIAAPPELAVEATAVQLLVKSSLGKVTLVDAPAAADHTATATLSRAGTGLELDVSIAGPDGKRETAAVIAGDGDIAALATGMVGKIGEVTQTTPQPVKPFALGQLRPYAAALRIAKADPNGAIALLGDAAPATGIGVPAIGFAFAELLAAAPTPAAKLVVARAIGATDVVATIGGGQDAVAASARAFAAIDRADLATAETALVNASGGLAALGRAAIAAQHDDVRLGQLLEVALSSDQHRAALALASTIVPEHVSASVHRTLIPLAEKAAAISPGVASRIGFAAAQAKVEVGRSLALVSVRELDQYAVDGLGAILDAHPDLAKPTLLRLRAEIAMRRGAPSQTAVDAYLEASPNEPRAQQYAAWSKIAPRPPTASGSAYPQLFDEPYVPPVAKPASSPLDILLPAVAGIGVLVLATLFLLQRKKRRAPAVAAYVATPAATSRPRRMPDSIAVPRTASKLKIDMTTPPIAPAAIDVQQTSAGRSFPSAASQSELGDKLQGLIDVELPADLQVLPAREPPVPLPPVARPPSVLPPPVENPFDDADPLGYSEAPQRPSASLPVSFEGFELGAPDMMPLGSDPQIAFPGGSTPAHDLVNVTLDEPGPRGEYAPPPAHTGTRSLAAMLAERGKLPWLEAVGLVDQICVGLAQVHDRGEVHGGVQPSTISITGRVASLGEELTVNKPPWGPKLRSRTAMDDLYALGATLTVMLNLDDVPPKLADLVAGLRASRITSIKAVRAAFKALFDF